MTDDHSLFVHGFWSTLKKETGGLPGQERWISANATQFTPVLNCFGDLIAISIERPDVMWLNVSGHEERQGKDRASRMQLFSHVILTRMGDQELGGSRWSIKDRNEQQVNRFIVNESDEGRSIKIRLPWERDDESKWPEAASWMKNQFDRLHEIINCKCGTK